MPIVPRPGRRSVPSHPTGVESTDLAHDLLVLVDLGLIVLHQGHDGELRAEPTQDDVPEEVR